MSSRSEAAMRSRRDAQLKKVLIFLAPVLLGLLVWQGPKTYKALMGGSAPPPPTTTATTTTTPSTSTPTTPPPGTASSGGSGGLPESDPPVTPGTGQLLTFTRFVGRDPFRPKPAPASTGTPNPSTPDPAADTASLEVNGTAETVEVGDSFPASDPVFKLVSLGEDSVTVGLVSGTFSNGQETIVINIGETLVLVSDPDGTRYAIKLAGVA
jgi:hypothetical protein